MSRVARNDSLITVQLRVLKALILRDVRTRFFGNGFGYIVAILWPLTHIVVLLIVYSVAGRVAPYGNSLLQFLSIALIPAIGFRYMSRFIVESVMRNKPLTNFPIVKCMDIIIARCILETAALFCVIFLLSAVLYVMDEPVMPTNSWEAASAIFFTIVAGVGFGTFCGVIAIKYPGIMLPMILVHIIVYITSGIIFIPSALPQVFQDLVSWNPILHAVEWMRESYYADYRSPIIDKQYLIITGTSLLFIGLFIERAFRKFLNG